MATWSIRGGSHPQSQSSCGRVPASSLPQVTSPAQTCQLSAWRSSRSLSFLAMNESSFGFLQAASKSLPFPTPWPLATNAALDHSRCSTVSGGINSLTQTRGSRCTVCPVWGCIHIIQVSREDKCNRALPVWHWSHPCSRTGGLSQSLF